MLLHLPLHCTDLAALPSYARPLAADEVPKLVQLPLLHVPLPPLPSDSVTTHNKHDEGPTAGSSSFVDKKRTLRLANGKTVHFKLSEIPQTPAAFLAKDIPRIAKIWDDAHPSWDGSSSLISIKGHPIALKYWPEIYQHGFPGQWETIKKVWTNWKDIALRWHRDTPENFWREFSEPNGQHWSYTKILNTLQQQRKEENEVLARRAQEEAGGGFATEYSYRKGGKRSISLTDSAAIARYFLKRRRLGED